MLNKAIKEYKKAAAERSAARVAYENAKRNTSVLINAVTDGKSGKDKFAEWNKNRDAINAAGDAENTAKTNYNIACAVVMACGQNVANIANNIFIDAVYKDPEKWKMPTHYKKFETAFYKVLDPEYFYFTADTYSFQIVFKLGEYGHREVWTFSTKNGCLDIDETRDKKRSVSTLPEIKKEARQAVKVAENMRRDIEKLRSKYDRKQFKTYISALMPYVEINAIHDNYRLF